MPGEVMNERLHGQPLPAPACPLCGGANACAVAATGDFNTPCWCRGVTFTAELLASVPDEMKGRACICRSCAEAALRDRTTKMSEE
jgi:hypothetical protein